MDGISQAWMRVGAFAGFGPSLLCGSGGECNADALPEGITLERRLADSRRALRHACPRRPGVYGMLNEQDELLYVGKSKCLRERLSSYLRRARRPAKSQRIVQLTKRIVWEPLPHEFAALVREMELIKRFRPRLNVHGQPERTRRAYVCLGRNPAPYAFISNEPAGRSASCFGPVRSRGRLAEAVRVLNDEFQLRDCPSKTPVVFANQLNLFSQDSSALCMRWEVETCLGPCAGQCTRGQYDARVRAARAFLRGEDLSLLEGMEARMLAASEEQAFERAASLRDSWQRLCWLRLQLDRLEHVRRTHSFIYPLRGTDGRERWYFIHQGFLAATRPAPTDARSRKDCRALLDATYDQQAPQARVRPEDLDIVLVVAAWFRKYPNELSGTLPPAEARSKCKPKVRVASGKG